MLTVTIATTDAAGAPRRSLAVVRISDASECAGGPVRRVFAVEGARCGGGPRVAACAVPAADGPEAVWAVLARACGALARADWTEP